jgi:hypothetical protein
MTNLELVLNLLAETTVQQTVVEILKRYVLQ